MYVPTGRYFYQLIFLVQYPGLCLDFVISQHQESRSLKVIFLKTKSTTIERNRASSRWICKNQLLIPPLISLRGTAFIFLKQNTFLKNGGGGVLFYILSMWVAFQNWKFLMCILVYKLNKIFINIHGSIDQ